MEAMIHLGKRRQLKQPRRPPGRQEGGPARQLLGAFSVFVFVRSARK